MLELTYREAIREALREEMRRDESVFQLGEDIGRYGGTCKVTVGLIDEFGPDRVRDMPLSEAGIVGTALGAALVGMRPVAEIMYMDFSLIAADQILNQVAKAHYMSAGQLKAPLVIRTPQNCGISAATQHSQSLEALYTHIPGLIVIFPSTPYDAKGLLKSAIRSDNPVLFIECRPLYDMKGPVPEDEYLLPIGKADIKREGRDVTVVGIARNVVQTLEAAKILEKEGIDIEVIDPRTIHPLDKDMIIHSVKKTNKLIIVHDAWKTCGIGAEIAATLAEDALDYLDAPIKRVAMLDTSIPYNPKLEQYLLPKIDDIVKAVKEIVQMKTKTLGV
jgi:pyruvate/2-oxoglutarate/acetoin dehydrogenase E1 component